MTAAEVIARVVRPHVELSRPEPLRFQDRVAMRTEIANHVAQEALAALRGAGFAVVPREATDAMAQEANGTVLIDTPDETARIAADDARRVYRAMVAAAEPRTGGE